MGRLAFLILIVLFLCISSAVYGVDTYSQTSGNWGNGATWTAGVPSGGDNVFISSGDVVTITDLDIDFNIIIQAGGELRVTNNLTVSGWNYIVTNNGIISVGNTYSLSNNVTVDNHDSIYVGGSAGFGQSTTTIFSGGVLDVGPNGVVSNGDLTLQAGSVLRIGGDFSVGTTGGPATTNGGVISVGGDFLANNGNYINGLGSQLNVIGTAEFKNGSNSINLGSIDVTGLFTVQSGDLTNSDSGSGDDGYILARGGLLTTNGGCVMGGALDYIGVYTNNSGCDMAGNGVTLPVELVFFNAESFNSGVMLTWQTATERNNKGFQVEYSADGIMFGLVSFVNGHGNSSVSHQYNFFCRDIYAGIGYYRLVQVDYDGSKSYSQIIEVNYVPNVYSTFTVFQDGDVYVIKHGGKDASVLTIYDSGGTVLYSGVVGRDGGVVPVDFLSSGMKIFTLGGNSMLVN